VFITFKLTMEENIRRHICDAENTKNDRSKWQKINKKGGSKRDEIWEYFVKGDDKGDGHFSASCYHCEKIWQKGKLGVLKAHFSNEYL